MAQSYDEKRWTSADGLELFYRDYAGAEGAEARVPVVCLHGLTRNSRDFGELAEHIAAQGRRVIVPEMRGRGFSDYAPTSSSYNPLQYVADVEKLFLEQQIERFISVGTSMGGLMTMLLAAVKPGRLEGLVMNDIGPEVELAGLERIGGYVGQGRSYPTWMHAAKSLQCVHGEAFPDWDLDQWLEMAKRTLVVSQNGRISYDYDMAIAEPLSEPGNAAPDNLWTAFEALAGVPMVLIRGELSDLLSPETVERMARINPEMKLVAVPRVGHAPTLDEPEARAAIDGLLSALA
ncbi:MAG: alpha/beta hydrolase [Erythrobacter sp.]|uniref:alpha/beta fold hydrolase n=1 Tax=Erythrobacter sp. TaxID=1042 RepID=UPI002626A7F6|nr:alpha/beta hydrolase [Erythrobacter sp.]MDJ0977085.1 alpha/beta hydrolase [Erythrobacter sp.]